LGVNERLVSKEGQYYMTVQKDGNLVIYSTTMSESADIAIWSSRTVCVAVPPASG